MLRTRLRRSGDLLLALLFLGVALAQNVTDGGLSPLDHVGAALVALAVAAAVWRRQRDPLVLALVVLASLLVRPLVPVGADGSAYGFPALLAAYTCAAWLEGWRLRAAGAVAVASGVVLIVSDNSSVDLGTIVFFALLFGGPWVAGRGMRLGRERQELLGDRARLLELQRDEQARAAVAEERRRIARELHDVVSHAISVTVLQARGGRRSLDADPAEARAAFDTIERTGAQALGEMRRLLGLLRGDDGESLAPQPTLDRIEALAGELRAAGLAVDLSIDGEPGPLAPGVDLSAYRIVQEALTNALKHAGPARVSVRVSYGDDALTLAVEDDGTGAARPAAVAGGGHGLVGIRERVALVGGEVEAGPLPTGGYAVSARLPYQVP